MKQDRRMVCLRGYHGMFEGYHVLRQSEWKSRVSFTWKSIGGDRVKGLGSGQTSMRQTIFSDYNNLF